MGGWKGVCGWKGAGDGGGERASQRQASGHKSTDSGVMPPAVDRNVHNPQDRLRGTLAAA